MKNTNYRKTTAATFCAALLICGPLFAKDDGLAPEVTDLNAKDVSMQWGEEDPYLEKPYLSSAPKDMKDGLAVGVLGKDGGDKEMILAFAREIAEEPNKRERYKTDSILISYKDKLIFESYYRRGRQNLPHFQMSITKSYTAFALGRAIQLGYLTMDDLNKPVVDYLKDLDRSKLAEGAENITLAEALNMKSGIKLIKEKIQPYKETPEKLVGQKQVQAYFESCEAIPPAPKRDFRYQPADPALIMQVLEVIVPGTAKDFIQKELMGKMGIKDYAWQADTSLLPKSAAGSSFRSRDMIKIGKLILDKGKWDGEQLIPEEFMKRALSPISVSYGANYYGYFCWYQDFKLGDKKYQYLQLRGALGQFVFIFPELELIVVSTGHGAMGFMLQDVPKRIIPAFVANDIVIADFEGDSYGGWKIEGAAFGAGPARGKLGRQGPVVGYKGRGLANTFRNGDGSTGTLSSPPFKIDRNYLTLLIGGGSNGNTALQVIVDGRVVASRSGMNDEELMPTVVDMSEYAGKTALIRIVDHNSGGWGHLLVDHIVLTDTKPDLPIYRICEKHFKVKDDYLVIPIQNEGRKGKIRLFIDGKPVRDYEVVLSEDAENTDWYAFFTIKNYKGSEARVEATKVTEEGFALVKQADEVPGSKEWYREPHRPQFHFTQQVGWNNDPNGMVYHNGEYHLFFQHNPLGILWGNMTWGHATSKDLLHWEQQPNALFPYVQARGICASGSAVIDKLNTGGWGKDTMIAFFSDNRTANNGESIAYSSDNGSTFTYYEKSPVYHHPGRDAKVIWYKYDQNDMPLNDKAKSLGGHWVMAVYDEKREPNTKGRPPQYIQFLTSTDLKDWTYQDHDLGYFECPELFELPVLDSEGNPSSPDGSVATRWVVFGANAEYKIGEFDGRSFKPDHEDKYRLHYGTYYAAQTFNNTPDGRKIQIGWVRIPSPGPYNQHFSFPHNNTLRTTPEGIRMFAEPVAEIAKLHGKKNTISAQTLPDGIAKSTTVDGNLFDIRADFDVGTSKSVVVSAGNVTLTYDAVAKTLLYNKAKASPKDAIPLEPIDGRITLQILIDNSILEVIGNNGRIYLTEVIAIAPKSCDLSKEHKYQGNIDKVTIQADGGNAKLNSVVAYEMKSIWAETANEN